jgi:acyl-CoA thioester hydrolase
VDPLRSPSGAAPAVSAGRPAAPDGADRSAPAAAVDRPAGAGGGREAVHRAQVRWSDPDTLGHVNHARYLSYFEDARMDLLALAPTGVPGTAGNRGCIAARVAVDYLSPVTYRPGLTLTVTTTVTRVGTSSWTLDQRMSDAGTPVARCECVLVAYDYPGGRSRPLDEDERAFWSGYRT